MLKLLGSLIFTTVAIMTLSATSSAQSVNTEMARLCMQSMDDMDTDGNNAVSRAEFMQANETLFAAMDNNGDGTLAVAEREITAGQVIDALLANVGMLWDALWGMIFG